MFCRKKNIKTFKKIHYKELKFLFNTDETYEGFLLRSKVSVHMQTL